MTDIFEEHGDPNTWTVHPRVGYIQDAQHEDVLYDLSNTRQTYEWLTFVLDAIKEKYNRG